MKTNNLNLIYALKNGQVVSIADVESGLKCDCVCPSCSSRLIAKKGKKMAHHFAHYSGENCEYGYETSLHLAAKDILLNAKKMMIPSVRVKFPNSYKNDILLSDAKEIPVDRVELERKFDSVIPDVVVYSRQKKLFVEIFVTHAIDEVKLKKLKEQKISTLEIDLSKKDRAISPEELSNILLMDSAEKYWCYNASADKCYRCFCSKADYIPVVEKESSFNVDNCPIADLRWGRKQPYANVINDCFFCEYCISADYKNGILCSVLCSGRSRISKIEDFDIPESERIKKSNIALSSKKIELLAHRMCPDCERRLILRFGKYGKFWGCSNFPDCKFTLSIEQYESIIRSIHTGKCPNCEGILKLRVNGEGKFFWGCSNFPDCKFTLSILIDPETGEVKTRL